MIHIYIVTFGLILTGIRLLIKYLTFFQQEHYNVKKFLHHLKNYYYNDYHILGIYILFIIYCLDLHKVVNIIIGIVLVVLSFTFKKMVIKLKVTKRIVRFFITYFLITGLYIYLLLKITDLSYASFLLVLLISPLIILANTINNPMEKLISHYYISKAIKKLSTFKGLIKIGITGSYGKTTTKNILSSILGTEYRVVMSPASFNTPLGISKTINNYLDPSSEILIVEMGAYRKGEIQYLTEMVKPDLGIVTAVGPQHLSTFKTIENVLQTKMELLESLPTSGIGIINIDNEYLRNYQGKLKCQVVTFGIKEKADYQAQAITYQNDNLTFDIYYQGSFLIKVNTNLLGYHNIYNILASVACAKEIKSLGINLSNSNIIEGIQRVKPVQHRLSVTKRDNITILDDSFNANLEGFLSAIDVVKHYDSKKIIITPGIVDAGEKQEELNRSVTKAISQTFDEVYIINNPAGRVIVQELTEEKYNHYHIYNRFNDAYQAVLKKYQNDKIVLLIENDLPDNFLERRS